MGRASTRYSLSLRESVGAAAKAAVAQHKRSSRTQNFLRGLSTRLDHVKPGEFGEHPRHRGQYRAKPSGQPGGRCNDSGWTTCKCHGMDEVEPSPAVSNDRTERPAVSVEMQRVVCALDDVGAAAQYAAAYTVMRSRHGTRVPTLSLMRELGFDDAATTKDDRRHDNVFALLNMCEAFNETDEIVCALRQRRDRGRKTTAPTKGSK